ncbi:MAG: 6-bladed beta-propeller [Candidatus Hydrogenedentes bacterium]|nr:6-bladed beta-propeller [Candidatus Hydrogenedentota bacterium]
MLCASLGFAEETYRFERMWPTLQQPWYFEGWGDLATDSLGNVYILETYNNRVRKFNSDGVFQTQWGTEGEEPGQFSRPSGIAINESDEVFVSDTLNTRIQKFTGQGVYLKHWGVYGGGPGQFLRPGPVATDHAGNLYVADTVNRRIQIYTAEGRYLKQWSSLNPDDPTRSVTELAVDAFGNVYLLYYSENQFRKFSSNGVYLTAWGGFGNGPGEFYGPNDITVDALGAIYVADTNNHRIQKFASDGTYVTQWGNSWSDPDTTLTAPWKISVDGGGKVCILGGYGDDIRVVRLSFEGAFLTQWTSAGEGPGEFGLPYDMAVDVGGNVYVCDLDSTNNRIQKFDSEGRYLREWGPAGPGLAVDALRNVYVADTGDASIRKYSTDGEFLMQWGGRQPVRPGDIETPRKIDVDGAGNIYVANRGIVKFSPAGAYVLEWQDPENLEDPWYPTDLAADALGNVYVADNFKNRILKFSPDGSLISQWGHLGDGPGEFWILYGLTVDIAGDVYVVDSGNRRVQKFDADGTYLTEWGSLNEGAKPSSVAVDTSGNVFIGEFDNHIVKYSWQGAYLTQWGHSGAGPGEFDEIAGIAVDATGNVYVADWGNNRVQKFSGDGLYLAELRVSGAENSAFSSPTDVATDALGNAYVPFGFRIVQKFAPDGEFLTQLGSSTGNTSVFFSPVDVAVDISNNVYVADGTRIVKLGWQGDYLSEWGNPGSGPGEFFGARSVAVDNFGYVYVVDSGNHRIQEFSSDGIFQTAWGSLGRGPGQFNGALGVAVDGLGYVYVADAGNHRIQTFSSDGMFQMALGTYGYGPGEFKYPSGVAVDKFRNIYVLEMFNHRVQKFRLVNGTINGRAIVVAAGGKFAANDLWQATGLCANFAYRALTYQGFEKEGIQYLSSDVQLDLDNNGQADDVDGDCTKANLEQAITVWSADADDLVVYLIDHGGSGTFRLNATETLSAAELAVWLNQVQGKVSGKVIVIYDACQSGSFVEVLRAPGRIVITSAAADENAYFLSTGTISFSNFFWTHVFNGYSVLEAFNYATAAISQTVKFQTPQLDDPGGLAATTHIGNGTVISADAPVIGAVLSNPQTVLSGTTSAELAADPVTDAQGVARVWAVIQPPDWAPPSADNPVQNLPSLEMFPRPDNLNRWTGTYNGFISEGTYTIAVYARDREGNTSTPSVTSVSVNNPLSRKAIMFAGATQADSLWPAIENAVRTSHSALRGQGYSDEDIRFYSATTIPGVDGLNVLANLESALTSWAMTNTQDVVVFLVGNGADGVFELNDTETLSAAQLDGWLDGLQAALPGKVTLVYDASRSGSFVAALLPPDGEQRIVMASADADEAAAFLSNGDVSFSNFFWRRVLNGSDLERAFKHAAVAMKFSTGGQNAQLDDNANGVANEREDGIVSRATRLGAGILLAGDDPLIGSVTPEQTLSGELSTTLWADQVTTTGTIARVWAVITPPGFSARKAAKSVKAITDLPTVELNPAGDNRYEGTYDGFTQEGEFAIAVFARDTDGAVSLPLPTKVVQTQAASGGSEDINSDDTVDAVDVQLVINAALGIDTGYVCDVDNSGGVDAVDVQKVINAALGII